MIRKSSTLSVLRTSGVEAVMTHKVISTLVLGLSALALAAAVALLVMPAVEPRVPVRIANLERILQEIRFHHQEQLANPHVPPRAGAIFDHSRLHFEAELTWTRELLQKVEADEVD